MSHHDYMVSRHLSVQDPPFAALIMAAARKADTGNYERLAHAFPGIVAELRDRYNAPGGLLPHETRPAPVPVPASDEFECCASGSCEVCRR